MYVAVAEARAVVRLGERFACERASQCLDFPMQEMRREAAAHREAAKRAFGVRSCTGT